MVLVLVLVPTNAARLTLDRSRSSDSPDLFAVMEKTRMYIYRDKQPEEPLPCNGTWYRGWALVSS